VIEIVEGRTDGFNEALAFLPGNSLEGKQNFLTMK
jgi:hypothetical protein